MVKVRIVYGPPCSGKTTYIQEHKGDNDLLYDFDDIMTSLSGFESHSINRNLIDYVVDIRNVIIERLKEDTELDKAFFITTFIKEDLEDLLEGLEVEYIKMGTSKEVCLERLEECPLRKRKSALRKVIEEWFEEYGDEEVRTMSNRLDKRQTRSVSSDLKTRSESDEMVIEGYFAVFGKETELWRGAFEEIAPGAFDDTLSNDIRALINHDTNLVLGRNKSKTLELKVDSRGLWGSVEINPNDSDAVNLYERVKRGDVDQCSFGFNIEKEETDWREDGTVKWILKEIDLHEVSICTFPAYSDTGVQARKAEIMQHEKRQLDQRKTQLRERLKNGIKTTNASKKD